MRLTRPKKQLAPEELVGAGLFTADALLVDTWRNVAQGAGHDEATIGNFVDGLAKALVDSFDGRLGVYQRSHKAWPAELAGKVASMIRDTHQMPPQLTETWNSLQAHTRAAYARQGEVVLGAAENAFGGPHVMEEVRSPASNVKALAEMDTAFALVALDNTMGWLAGVLEGKE